MDEDGREEGPPRVGTEGGMFGRVKELGHKEVKYHRTKMKRGCNRYSQVNRFRVCKVANSVVRLLLCWTELSRCIILMLSVVARARDRENESLSSTENRQESHPVSLSDTGK